MYYFYGKGNQEHVFCPLYRGGLYLGESVMGGSTAHTHMQFTYTHIHVHTHTTNIVCTF